MVPRSHPLQELFVELVGRHYAEEIGIRDPRSRCVMSRICSRNSAKSSSSSRSTDVAGKPLTDVGEMLVESDPVYRARAFFRPRAPGAQAYRRLHVIFCGNVS